MFHRALAKDGFLVMEQTQKLPRETEHLFRRVTEAAQLFRKV
jgi:chemotaxis methyl-accepting protein methylase